MTHTDVEAQAGPHIKAQLLSHGTVETRDLARARQFYEEMFGFEVRQTSAISLMMRLGSATTIACVQTRGPTKAGLFSHFGLDMASREEVDTAYETAKGLQEKYGIKKLSAPVDQHGTYAFYIVDADDNWWEVLTNPPGGYSYVFDMEEDSRAWKETGGGKDRQARWEAQKKGE
ncbi:MAG: VOC family protein [Beijerinckiaceae bacterium]